MGTPDASSPKGLNISPAVIAKMYEQLEAHDLGQTHPKPRPYPIKPPDLMSGVVPKGKRSRVAMDWGGNSSIYRYANQAYAGLGFPGYPLLAELTLRSEYRSPSETLANEMVRKWIRFNSSGEGDKSERIKKLMEAFERFQIRDLFRWAAMTDGFFGHAQIYIATKADRLPENRKLPLIVDPATVKKGDIKAFRQVEPQWTSPSMYNASDPTRADFYYPTRWFVMGTETHSTRLLSFSGRPLPDILKPAYNFGGMSISQLMEPYVSNWIRTRDAVSDLIWTFSTSGILTDMGGTLQSATADPGSLLNRARLFTLMKRNNGLMMLDKDMEDFFQFNVPLSSLDKLQAQAAEQMAMPSHTPLVKLLGVTPAGLNASSDGEIRVYYDYVHSMQEGIFRRPLQRVTDLLQLNEFGNIDQSITFEFEPLYEPTEKELADVRKSDAEAGQIYITGGVIDNAEERQRVATDPRSGYVALDPSKVPEPPTLPDEPGDGDKAQPSSSDA